MATNRYFNPRVYEGKLYTPPIDVIAGALEMAQNKYDVNFAAAEKLRNQFVKSRTQDRAAANKLQDDINKKVDSIAAKYSGDYSAATADLYSLQSEISRSFGPGGEAAAIQGNALIEAGSLEEEQKRLAKGEITQEQYNNLQNYYKSAAPTTLDETTGVYNTLNPVALAKYVAHRDIYAKSVEKTKPRIISRDVPRGKDGNGNLVYETIKQAGIDPQELYAKTEADILGDDQFMNYARQTAQMEGKDLNTYLSGIMDDYAINVIPRDSGLFEDTRSTKLYDDFNYREGVKFGHQLQLKAVDYNNAKGLAKFKKDLDNEAEGFPQESILVPADGANSIFKPVSADETVYGDVFGLKVPIGSQKRSVDATIKLGTSPTINVPLLASLKEVNPTATDSDIWARYNDAVSKNQDYYNVTMTQFKTTNAQQEEADRLMPSLVTGRREIYRVNGKTGKVEKIEDVDTKKGLAASWANKNNPMKSDYGALGKTRVSSGKVPFGTIMPDPDGGTDYYVVKENRADFENLQKYVLNPAFEFIQEDHRRQGDPFDLYINKKPAKVIGRKEYTNGRMRVVYYNAKRTGNGYEPDLFDPYSINGTLLTPAQLEDMLISTPDLMSTFPSKTKAAGENEQNQQR